MTWKEGSLMFECLQSCGRTALWQVRANIDCGLYIGFPFQLMTFVTYNATVLIACLWRSQSGQTRSPDPTKNLLSSLHKSKMKQYTLSYCQGLLWKNFNVITGAMFVFWVCIKYFLLWMQATIWPLPMNCVTLHCYAVHCTALYTHKETYWICHRKKIWH